VEASVVLLISAKSGINSYVSSSKRLNELVVGVRPSLPNCLLVNVSIRLCFAIATLLVIRGGSCCMLRLMPI
jgi:hypothetical protein